MDAFFILISLSVVFVILIAVVLFWAVFAGQFEDSNKHACSILEDDD